jgi:amino acid transporter
MATAVVVGTVIGSGIFKKPQSIAENLPYFGLAAVAWIAGGVLALLGALAYAEVAALFPKAGGNYVFLRDGYGRLAGFLWGWVDFFMIRCGSIAALATMFTLALHDLLKQATPDLAKHIGYWPQRFVTVGVILLLAAINARGVKWGGGLQLLITIVKVGSLLFFMALPFIALSIAPSGVEARSPDPARLQPTWPTWDEVTLPLAGGFATALLGVLWAYHGWMNVTPVAEEVKEPQRNLPLSLILGVVIVIFLYLGTSLAYSLVLSRDEMMVMKSDAPEDRTVAIGFCRRLLGPLGVALAAAAVMTSVFGALNGNLLVGPRLLFAMSRDRLAPEALERVHPRYRTPALAIWVLAGWSSGLVLGVAALQELELLKKGKDHFDILTELAMFGAVIFETMAVLSIFAFRKKYPDLPRPYSCVGYPWVPALYVLLPLLIVTNYFVNQRHEAMIGTFIVGAGVACYYAARLDRNHLK